jgi:hypothetical protein
MAHLFGGSGGGVFVASVVSDEVYDPVFDTSLSAQFVYQVLPDFYRALMDDQDIFELIWQGAMQGLSADLLNLWQIDYSKSLNDVPVISQRKWQKIDLLRVEDFVDDPAFDLLTSSSFVYDEPNAALSCTWTSLPTGNGAGLKLLGQVDEDTSLEWSVELRLSEVQTRGVALFGYFGFEEGVTALAAAVIGDPAVADLPVIALYHVASTSITASLSSVTLKMATAYRLECTYTARTGAAVLKATELRAEKFLGTEGVTGGVPGDTITNEFTDASVNFDTEGIVPGDILVVFGSEYVIESVSGSLLVVETYGLPVDLEDLPYTIIGEVFLTSVNLDLPGEAADPTFSCSIFGTSSLGYNDVSNLGVLFSSPTDARRQSIVGETTNWTFLDPTIDQRALSIPRLQDEINEYDLLLFEGTDYFLDEGVDPLTTTIKFQEPPQQVLWAEYIGYDEFHIRDNFGTNVGLDDLSSDQYKARVRGLYFAYFQGPTVEAIRRGVHILVGLPIAEEAGTVEVINLAYSGTLGLIRVSGTDYLFPLPVGTNLQVGDEVEQFQPLSRGVEVIDYLIEEEWYTIFQSVSEIEKFHTFLVRLNLDAFAVETLTLASIFVEAIKPTWKRALFSVFKALEDDLVPEDEIDIKAILSLFDVPCDRFLIAYDDNVYEGEEADWKYDQGIETSPTLFYGLTSAGMRGTSIAMSGVLSMTNASDLGDGVGTALQSDPPGSPLGAGPLSDVYFLFGLYTNAADGESTAGSDKFIAPSAFERVEIGDKIDITGEAQREVTSIIQNGTILYSGDPNDFVDGETFIIDDGTAVTFEIDFDATSTPGNVPVAMDVSWTPNQVRDSLLDAINNSSSNVVALDGGAGVIEIELNGSYLTMSDLVTDVSFQVSTDDVILDLDSTLLNTATGIDWSVRGTLNLCFPSPSDTYHFTLMNNEAKKLFYDKFLEDCPDEELIFTADISPGYEETVLSGEASAAASQAIVLVSGGDLENEIGGPGAVVDKYIVFDDGSWHLVSTVDSPGQLTLAANTSIARANSRIHLADEVLAGTLTFTNGLATVSTSVDLTSAVAAGDFIQVVSTPDQSNPVTSAPVVEVLSILGFTITLTTAYTGDTAAGTKAIRRGDSSIMPKAITLPLDQTTTSVFSFTDFYGTAGGQVSSTLAEPEP